MADNGGLMSGNDPFTQPSFKFGQRLRRAVWNIVWHTCFKLSPRPLHRWRAWLLRRFGATLGRHCHVYPGVKVWAPWNLTCGDFVGIADGVTLYSMDRIALGDFVVVSQGAHLCGGSHDYNSANFQLFARPISVGARAWICAEAFLHPGVTVPEGAVVGARSVVHKDLPEAWAVYAGSPCIKVGVRRRHEVRS